MIDNINVGIEVSKKVIGCKISNKGLETGILDVFLFA